MERNIAIYNSKFNGMFYRFSFGEEDELVKKFPAKKICNIGTTGISYIIEDSINSMDEYNFKLWMNYHLSTCEEDSISDYSMFGLYFAQKF